MSEISGRVAFVTGGAKGLGLAMAKAFAAQGAKIMLADRDAAGLVTAEAELKAAGADVASVVCDVADLNAVKAAADATMLGSEKCILLSTMPASRLAVSRVKFRCRIGAGLLTST